MIYRLSGLKLPIEHGFDDLLTLAARRLGVKVENLTGNVTVTKKSLDARKKSEICWVYTIDVSTRLRLKHPDLTSILPLQYVIPQAADVTPKVVVVGSGPAGLLAALTLCRAGLRPIVLERGRQVEQRVVDVERFWASGGLDEQSNVQFGEGGAGTFSDGKLTTGTHDPRIRMVLDEFVKAGAPAEIAYLSKPHVGTDRLRGMVVSIRKRVEAMGGEFCFGARFCGFSKSGGRLTSIEYEQNGCKQQIPCDYMILAIGHSARDTFQMLSDGGVAMTQKPFSVGVRVEHPQSFIDRAQYGRERGEALPPADYKLSTHLPNGRGVYTFCMCPGGTVVAASSEDGGVVTNGMSDYSRNGSNANSALLVSVNPGDFDSSDPLSGVKFQRRIERAAYVAAGNSYRAPTQTVGDLLGVASNMSVSPTYRPGVVDADLRSLFPDFVGDALADGLRLFDRKIKGFADGGTLLTAPETRSSSPVRIVRDHRFFANIEGLVPCGEGAGYAGGIVSSAVDGIKCAEAVIMNINKGM